MSVSWFTNSKAILAKPLPSSSIFGVGVALIGARNMISGAINRSPNGQPLVLGSKKALLRLSVHPKKYVFLWLNYPKDYGASLLDHSFNTKQTHSAIHLPKDYGHKLEFDQSLKQQPKQSCVLCWVHKTTVKTLAPSSTGSRLSTFKSLIPPLTTHLEDHLSNKVKVSNLKNSDIHGSVYPPLVSARCSRCLGLGHTKKLCKGSIRCKSCFNYGHLSYTYLSKGR